MIALYILKVGVNYMKNVSYKTSLYNPHADKPIGVSGDGKYLIYLSGRRSKLKKRLNSNQVSIINKNLGGTYGKKMGS